MGFTDCADPARDAEYNDWYDNVHVPDVLQAPGVMRITRYHNIDPESGPGKYLSFVEIESDDIEKTIADLKAHLGRLQAAGRFTDLLVDVSFSVCRELGSQSR
jgi:hypothetical protein